MLMISFLTPDIIDSMIWIIPNVISILVRPYFIRYVHNKSTTMYNEIKVIFNLMLFALVGNLLIAYATSFSQKNFSFRIIICTLGWTISGFSFDLVSFFASQLKNSLKQSCYYKQNNITKCLDFQQTDQNKNQTFFTFQLLGYTLGYLIIFGIFFFKDSSNIKGFHSKTKLIYSLNGLVTLLSAVTFYFLSKTNLPTEDPQIKKNHVPFKISYDYNYYLPGFSQLLSSNFATFQYLFIHFTVYFCVDIVTIYCTMWLAGSVETSQLKLSQSYFFGIQYGVVFLMLFSYVSLTTIFDSFLNFLSFLNTSIIVLLLGIVCWIFFNIVSFMIFVLGVGVLFRKYNKQVEDQLRKQSKMFQICKQIVQRFEKIFVLCHMPFTIMILIGRDDIEDCILWSSILLLIACFLLTFKVKIYSKHNIKQSLQKTKQT